ncbi:MAG: thioredoxin family protein [Gammaproteobacteria bacterium]|nr:thioredoxin family protein [Gammaproteobacteria bacterium]
MLEIKVFGSGCSTCKNLKKLIDNIVKQNGIDAKVEYVNDFAEMARLNILSAPAVVINGIVKASGRIPARTEIEQWLSK